MNRRQAATVPSRRRATYRDVLLAFRRTDQKTPRPGVLPGDLLHPRAVVLGLPVPVRAGLPLVLLFLGALQGRFHARVPPPLQRHQIAHPVLLQRLHVLRRPHAPVAHQHEAPQAEALAHVGDDLPDGGAVPQIARKDGVGERQAVDHGHADEDLPVARPLVARVAVAGQLRGAGTLEVRAGQVVEHEVAVGLEEGAEVIEEVFLDGFLERQEGVESAVPALQLEGLDANAGAAGGLALLLGAIGGSETATAGIAGEEGRQPFGEAVFGGGTGETVGDQREDAVGDGAEQVGHVELGPQAAQDEERADAEGGERDGLDFAGLVAAAEFEDAIEVLIEELFGAEGDDGAAVRAAVLPDGLTDMDVLIGAATGFGLDDDREQRCYLGKDSSKGR